MSTKFDPEAIKSSAGEIGAIMDDMAAFSALKTTAPSVGSFEVAKWLEQIVQVRADGVVAHAEHLRVALEKMETKLTGIANDFVNADGENAEKIKASIGELQTDIGSDLATFDSNSSVKPDET